MKVLLLSLMLFLTGLTPIEENKEKFLNTVNEGYETYYQMTNEETDNYSILVFLGEVKEKPTYSIQFTSTNPNEYELVLRFKGDNNIMSGGTDGRGDTFIYGIMPSNDLELVVRTRESETNSYLISKVTHDDYTKLYLTSAKTGLGQGITKTDIKSLGVSSLTFILSIVFGSIILVAIIVILILALTKKGLFSKQKLQDELKDEFNYEEFVKQAMDQARQQQNPYNNPNFDNPYQQTPTNTVEVEATEVKDEEEPQKEVYEKVRDYDLEETKDVKAMLEKNGFNTDYSNMSSDDKNKIMLELMRMKDFKEISEQDYRSEVIKLWM